MNAAHQPTFSLGTEPTLLRAARLANTAQWEPAVAAFRQAIAEGHDQGEVREALAMCLMWLDESDEALLQCRRALKRNPGLLKARNNLIFLLDHKPETSIAEAWRARREWWKTQGAPLRAHWRPHRNDRDPERPLRVGYVSANFNLHSAASAFGAVVLRHTPQIEVYCYSLQAERYDKMTELFVVKSSAYRSYGAVDHVALANAIRGDRIDVLVDLMGHSGGNRLKAFCLRPAPVQVTAWGYATGTGCDVFDAFFADSFCVPDHLRRFYSEPVVRVPSIIPYYGPDYYPDVAEPPVERTGAFTFGSFSRPEKVTPRTLNLWAAVLARVPESRLLVKDRGYERPATAERLRASLAARGIAPDRLDLRGGPPTEGHDAHLAHFADVDLCLDTWPHGAGVSALEGFWSGVPIVTLTGERVPSRLSGSFLTLLGLGDLVTEKDADFVDAAARWATDRRAELATLRLRLRAMVEASPINRGYVRAVESIYRDLWRAWCPTEG